MSLSLYQANGHESDGAGGFEAPLTRFLYLSTVTSCLLRLGDWTKEMILSNLLGSLASRYVNWHYRRFWLLNSIGMDRGYSSKAEHDM